MQSDAFGLEFKPSSSMVALAVDDVEAKRQELEDTGIEFRGGILDSGVCHRLLRRSRREPARPASPLRAERRRARDGSV